MTGGLEYAGIDVFRLDNDDKIVEHRDVLQTCRLTPKMKTGCFRFVLVGSIFYLQKTVRS